ncbi:shaggy-related protein kinase theta [Diplogelasinospora grovesii]|uniref:non-specific serine/threonine protein kinase n=1 Tax=Diplogelasinospora grovesii TaxID=303347 RepID=A0AAN6S0G1_9PEZI|nr:shaggy-related protein kinase theta [Diplogelasinospora grovesii]
MGFFDHCDLDQRFKSSTFGAFPHHRYYRVVEDWDQRRTITVFTSKNEDEDFVFKALNRLIDGPGVAPDAISIKLSDDGKLLSQSHDIFNDHTSIPFYPSVTDFPRQLPKIRRFDLTEIDRLGIQVDLVTYEPQPGQPKRVAFKYYINKRNISRFWTEINCVIRIPKHPNIVSFDRLVIDTVGDEEKVVGFTTAFVPGGTVDDNEDRLFKLKYLKQLTEAIDYLNLNLKLGVVHGDLCSHNLLISKRTGQLGGGGGDDGDDSDPEHRDDCDVRYYAVFALYDIITRDNFRARFDGRYYLSELDPAEVLDNMQTWEKHPRVRLDSDVAEYRRVLETSPAPSPSAARHCPEIPPVDYNGNMVSRPSLLRQVLVPQGDPFLRWERPPSRHLPLRQGQRLLATGEVVGLQRGERRRG